MYTFCALRIFLIAAYNAGRRSRFDSWIGKIRWRRDGIPTPVFLGFLCGSAGKESTCIRETWVGKIPWRRERLPTPVIWPGEFHGLYSPSGCKELDMTERVSLSLRTLGFPSGPVVKNLPAKQETWVQYLGSIPVLGRSPGEGNGNPLQYSCLGNSMDRGAWWATAHGFTRV